MNENENQLMDQNSLKIFEEIAGENSLDTQIVIDPKLLRLFSLLNGNYLVNDTTNHEALSAKRLAIDSVDVVNVDRWILYQINNCLIRRSIGYIEGKLEYVDAKEISFPQIRSSDIVAIRFNRSNSLLAADFHRQSVSMMMDGDSKFCIRIDQRRSQTSVVFASKLLCSTAIRVLPNSRLIIEKRKLAIFDDDRLRRCSATLNAYDCGVQIDLERGTLPLLFEEDVIDRNCESNQFCTWISSQSDLEFSVSYSNHSSLQEFRFCAKKDLKKVLSSPPISSNVPIADSHSIRSMPSDKNNLPLGEGETKIESPPPPPLKTTAETKNKSNLTAKINLVQDQINSPNRSFELIKCSQRPPQPFDRLNSQTDSQMQPIYDLEGVQSILNSSNSPVIIVNKVPLSLIAVDQSESDCRSQSCCARQRHHQSIVNSIQYSPTSVSSINSRSDDARVGRRTCCKSLSELKKQVMHEMQKSNQYIKFINGHLRQNSVKIAFDRYAAKLRRQLERTADLLETYIDRITSRDNDNGGASQKSHHENNAKSDDQELCEVMIEKMRKLLHQLQLEQQQMFRLICDEIACCLIEINNKFFVNS